jgi:hypothetical protein
MGAPGPSHLGTGETTNLNRPEVDHEDRNPSPQTPVATNAPASLILARPRKPLPSLFLRNPLKTITKFFAQLCR